MKWTLRQLREVCRDGIYSFDERMDIQSQMSERKSDIIDIDEVHAKGYFLLRDEEFVLHCQFDVDVTLPSTRSLKPVVVPLSINVRERYVDRSLDFNAQDYEETTIVLEHDYIDLATSAVDNILLNIPKQVIAEDDIHLPSGKDWAVIPEEEYNFQNQAEEDQIDPRFAALKTLLTDQDN
ncbi:YceD family protein [Facklamia miroungae]|uniref:DUF177 domain-containing protein n=1 Tax=Facklamia miroungae TaxID=120956 RepID=A0A1G7UKE2_9LACT|nr:YceD family protein [Facklamia miroungae]NKZ30094.1 DUF177 domain-containing protein [Facklamia miroungae]SDG47200.1 uncharacterized protein SAMN05421791_11027 [Facklamia miroungae]